MAEPFKGAGKRRCEKKTLDRLRCDLFDSSISLRYLSRKADIEGRAVYSSQRTVWVEYFNGIT